MLDAGTVALAATTLLGNAGNNLKHRHILGVGLALILVALISLLHRNLAEDTREHLLTGQEYALTMNNNKEAAEYEPGLKRHGKWRTGVYCTMAGITLLGAVLILSLI